MKTVVKALLAATALFPLGVQAQRADWQTRGEARGEARGDWRAQRGADLGVRAEVQAGPRAIGPDERRGPGADRPDWRNRQRFDRQPDARPHFDQPRPDQPRPDQSRDWHRGEARPGPRPGDDNGADAVRRYQDRRDAATRGAWARGDRDRQDWERRDRGQRDWGQRDWGQRDWGSRGWNRDWRQDRRYDWNRYRGLNRGAYRLPRYYAPPGWAYGYRRFSIGVRLSPFLWGQDYWIDDPFDYRLPPAYGPYRWVRYYDDALLVDIRTGVVVDSVYGIFF